MRRTLALAALLAALLACPARTRAQAAPPAQAQAFQLGFALQASNGHTEAFLQSVKGLRDITDDVQGVSEVGKLTVQAEALRRTELRAYEQAVRLLETMGAPRALQAWAAGVTHLLGDKLLLSKEAQEHEVSDPNTAAVLATIDEAQAIKQSADGQQGTLLAWLKVTQGASGAWAQSAGALAANMDASVAHGRGLLISRTDILTLRDAAPDTAPPAARAALGALVPRQGNLAAIVRLPPSLVPVAELTEPTAALLQAFGASALARSIDREQGSGG